MLEWLDRRAALGVAVSAVLVPFAAGCGTATRSGNSVVLTSTATSSDASTVSTASATNSANTTSTTRQTAPPKPASTTRTQPPIAPKATFGHPTKSSGCSIRGGLPDPACTPGSIFADATVTQICTSGYSESVRDVSDTTREEVYAAYGIASHPPGSYELDHLIALELGGDNSVANLWPEASPSYHEKDKIENELHQDVCAGRVNLRTAQQQIARDWQHTAAAAAPAPDATPAPAPAPPSPASSSTGGSMPLGFCTTHTCIPSFDDGHGTIVQCVDGQWSHSGGLPGVCSHHGGAR